MLKEDKEGDSAPYGAGSFLNAPFLKPGTGTALVLMRSRLADARAENLALGVEEKIKGRCLKIPDMQHTYSKKVQVIRKRGQEQRRRRGTGKL